MLATGLAAALGAAAQPEIAAGFAAIAEILVEGLVDQPARERWDLFLRGTMNEVYQKLIDRTRAPLDLKQVKTIFGFSHRSHKIAKRGRDTVQGVKAVEAHSYDLTVFKVKWGNLTLKISDKGGRVLRIEVVAHNVKNLRGG